MAHAQFEEFCALAASGQLNVVEARALHEHLQECADCRRLLSDLRLISGTVLPGTFADSAFPRVIPEGMRDRFFSRAEKQGIHFQAGPQVVSTAGAKPAFVAGEEYEAATEAGLNQPQGWRYALRSGISRFTQHWQPVALAMSACVICFAFGAKMHHQSGAETALAENPRTTAPGASLPAAAAVRTSADNTQRTAIETRTAEYDSLLQQRMQLENALEAANKEKNDAEKTLQEKMAAMDSASAREHEDFVQQTAGLNSRAQALQSQLDALQQKLLQTEAVLAVQEQETRKYSARASELETQLANMPHVPPINPDEVQSLVAARNLHIIDVYDSDGSNRKRAFGRVFYVEGRSLVFYAYDLGKAHTEKRITFHVWGAHSSDAEKTISLGLLHDEDPSEQRWALTFDDPKVLAKINSVFVTIEPGNRDVQSPTGKKVLYAFLGEKANHP